MRSVLIISSTYNQSQHIKNLILNHSYQFRIAGTVDNSVLGMSMIESSHPDIVIMPAYMSFWNAEDLINYLLPRGISPQFVILQEDDEPISYGAATAQVAVFLPSAFPTGEQLMQALESTSRRNESPGTASVDQRSFNPAVQHSLEVMELLMGLTPIRTGSAQMEYGRLRVGREHCWVILCTPQEDALNNYPVFNFFSQFDNLEDVFSRLASFLSPLGRSEICIYRESNLCILLTAGQNEEPDWEGLCRSINRLLIPLGFPNLLFEISDSPLPFDRWPSQCRELLLLRDYRFFLSSLFLQPKIIRTYKTDVTQAQIHEQLSALSLAIQNQLRKDLIDCLDKLESMVSHSLSKELYSFVATQLVVLYSRLRYSYNLTQKAEDFNSMQFPSVSHAFEAYRRLFLGLYDKLGSLRDSDNPIITEACNYISHNLQDRLALETVADHVHVSPTYLSRLFKREVGTSFSDYINQSRITRAMQLLESPYKITDIAGMVGFDSAKYFSQVFRKLNGKTPQQYRNEVRKESGL